MVGHDVDVALWQRGILLDEGNLEIGPACYLFETSISAFSALLQVLAANSARCDSESYLGLRDEFRKFYVWNEGFSTRSGNLDHILARSKNLKGTVLGLMVHWVRTFAKIPQIMPEFDWSTIFAKFAELQIFASKGDQIAKAALSDMKSDYSFIHDADIGNSSDADTDSDSDLESTMSEYVFEDVIEDLSTYMESLTDLSPSLDHPATDQMLIENVNTSLIDEFSTVPEPARPFVLIIRDRFPSLDAGIVKKLGEANWKRRERLGMKLASAPVLSGPYTNDDDDSSVGGTIVDPRQQVNEDEQTIISAVRSSVSFANTFQSVTVESQFSEPSIFDNASISDPAPRKIRPPESVTSFATSAAEGLDHGQRRIPNLPDDHVYGSAFQCKICGDNLTGIRHRADWKKHVYDDLEPYICLFSGCDLELHTFKSRREWQDHEFQVHRVTVEWHCNLCKEIFKTQGLFRGHINESHSNDIGVKQVEEFIFVSKRFIPSKVETEICPFCLIAPSQTQGGFVSHVGKHQQEISLAALPRLELEGCSDDESENSKGPDDDDDSSHDSGGSGDNKGDDRSIEDSETEQDFPLDGTDDIETEAAETATTTSQTLLSASQAEMSERHMKNLSPPFQTQAIPRHSRNLSQDNQQPIVITLGPQNRMMSLIRDFEKILEKCEKLWYSLPQESYPVSLLANIDFELSSLRGTCNYLRSSSSNLALPIIEQSIENLAICRTQLLRLQKDLESINSHRNELRTRLKRSGLRQLFNQRQTSQTSENFVNSSIQGKMKDIDNILKELRLGNETLQHLQMEPQATNAKLSSPGQLPQMIAEEARPQLFLSPTGTLQVGRLEGPQSPVPNTDRPLEEARLPIFDEYTKSKEISDSVNLPDDLNRDSITAKGKFNDGQANTDVFTPEESDFLDDEVFPCKGCGEILKEGEAFELVGNRWHLNCFRCMVCGTLFDSDSNLLLVGDGSLICSDCTYKCSACGDKIEDLAILTGDQAFCATCFRCRNCKGKIENLRYARTSQGIFCMSCHESLMGRRRTKAITAAKLQRDNQLPTLVDKALPSLPPTANSDSASSAQNSRNVSELQNDDADADADIITQLSPRPR